MKVFINENIVIPGDYWVPMDKETFEFNLISIIDCISCLSFLNGFELYYNSKGIKNLLENLEWLNSSEKYNLTSIISSFRRVISKYYIKDWSENKIHKDDFYYIVQLDSGFTVLPSNGNSIAEACEHCFLGSATVLLNFKASRFNNEKIINVNRVDCNSPDNMKIISIDLLSDKKNSIKYYLNKRRPVEFKPNEQKHGQNHNKVRFDNKGNPISPLKCSNIEAAELLKTAISSKDSDRFFAFDFHPDRLEFIEFKSEDKSEGNDNPKGFHGYHPHDQRIPDEIRKFLDDNKDIFEELKNEFQSNNTV